MDSKRLSRRQLGLAAAAAAVPAAPAQQQAGGDDLAKARANAKSASEALRKVKLPQLLEPGFIFRP